MRNLKLEQLVRDMLYVNVSIDTYELEAFIQSELELNKEEIEELIEQIVATIDNESEALIECLTDIVAGSLDELIIQHNIEKYPEDAPDQLHLFEID